MANKVFEIQGLQKLIGKVNKLPKVIVDEVDAVLEAGAMDIAAEAKRRAPVDLGPLHNGISASRKGIVSFEVVSEKEYSPYVEFGTGGLVNVPAGLENYANQFRGKGIKEVNLPPQPFFFPALERQRPIIIKDIKDALARLK